MSKKGDSMKGLQAVFNKKNWLILILGLLVLTVIVLLIFKFRISAEVATTNPKYIVAYDRNGGANPTYIRDHLTSVESLADFPYSGVTVLPTVTVMSSSKITADQYKSDLAPLKNLNPKYLTHNLVRVLLTDPGDLSNNEAWTNTAGNFANLALAIKDVNDNSGFKIDGILFDNEGPYSRGHCTIQKTVDVNGVPTLVDVEIDKHGYWNLPIGTTETDEFSKYSTTCWPYIRSWDSANPTASIANYKAQAKLRGTEIAQQIANTQTGIKFMFMHSSDTSCTNMSTINIRANNVSGANEMLGPFLVGLLEGAKNTSLKMIDGGEESYYYRSAAKMDFSYNVRNALMATTYRSSCSFIPSTISSSDSTAWSNLFDVAFAMYNKTIDKPDDPTRDLWSGQTLSTIQTSMQYALERTDNYVWFYTEDVSSIDPTKSNYINKKTYNSDGTVKWAGGDWMSKVIAARKAVPLVDNSAPPLSPSFSPPPLTPSEPPVSSSPTLCEPTPAPVVFGTATSRTVSLSWTDSQNENGYIVKRNTVNSLSSAVSIYNSQTTNITSYQDTTVSPNTTYWYWITAYNGCGSGITNSAPIQVTTPIADRPIAPTNLIANGVTLAANISWSDNSNNETGFKLERKIEAGAWNTLSTLGANTTSYVDNGLTANTTYWYRAYSYNVAGNSDYSNEDPATAHRDSSVPTAPTNLAGSAVSTSQINLSWNASTDDIGVVGYYIYRNGVRVGSTSGTSYQDKNLFDNTTYSYQVSAFDAASNESPKSNTISVKTPTILDNPPTVAITSPRSGETVSGTITATANASDDKGVSKVDFYLDGVYNATELLTPYTWNWSTIRSTNSSHTIMARAYDTINQYRDSSVTVTVNNSSPAVISISNVRTSTTRNSATITWKTNVPATSQIAFGTSPRYGSVTPLDSNLTTSHSVTLIGLQVNTRYYYQIISTYGSNTKTYSSNLKTRFR